MTATFDFSDGRLLADVANMDDPEAGLTRLAEAFSPRGEDTLVEAARVVDWLREGRDVDLGDGVTIVADDGPGTRR